MDLLTVVMHEMGHILGYADTTDSTGMDGELTTGTRLTPLTAATSVVAEKTDVTATTASTEPSPMTIDGYSVVNSIFAEQKGNSWFADYLKNKVDPNGEIVITI